MTLYLRVAVGPADYLLAAARVTDVRPADARTDAAAVAEIDCRQLFGEPSETAGYRVSFEHEAAEATALIVDRLGGLVELGDDAFRALPPIGRFGALIDAVSVPGAGEAPALRLCVGPALFADMIAAEPVR
jgi:hypothetical protein